MAMITLCGYPSSGKSTRALQLKLFLEAKLAQASKAPALARLKVVIINDESLNLNKSQYDGTPHRLLYPPLHRLARLS